MRPVTGAGPRSAPGTGSTGKTGMAGCICAGSARAGTGRRCRLRAGPSGRWVCMRSRRKPAPDQVTARPAMQYGLTGQLGQAKERAMRTCAGAAAQDSDGLAADRAWVRWGVAAAVTAMLAWLIAVALIPPDAKLGPGRPAPGPGTAGAHGPAVRGGAAGGVRRRAHPPGPRGLPRLGPAAGSSGWVPDHPGHGRHRRVVRAGRAARRGRERRCRAGRAGLARALADIPGFRGADHRVHRDRVLGLRQAGLSPL